MYKYIWIQNKKYYLYSIHNNWQEALKTAKQKRKKNGSRYFIKIEKTTGIFSETKYLLYLTKCIKIW